MLTKDIIISSNYLCCWKLECRICYDYPVLLQIEIITPILSLLGSFLFFPCPLPGVSSYESPTCPQAFRFLPQPAACLGLCLTMLTYLPFLVELHPFLPIHLFAPFP